MVTGHPASVSASEITAWYQAVRRYGGDLNADDAPDTNEVPNRDMPDFS